MCATEYKMGKKDFFLNRQNSFLEAEVVQELYLDGVQQAIRCSGPSGKIAKAKQESQYQSQLFLFPFFFF